MNLKSISLLLIFLIIHFIAYKYVKHKQYLKEKEIVEVKYVVPPTTYEDYFEFKNLNKFYNNMFNLNKDELILFSYFK
mgnify:CR=1 FL=1|tara:strand:+ start:1085 stop:1318 length:234 start_codon:yes stop_codon:yes gene_type:complete